VVIVAVVLAAGEGSRFTGAEHKLRTRVDGVPLVRRAVDAAVASGIGAVVVVTGAVGLDDLLPAGCSVVTNPGWAAGQASSLRGGIAAADALGADAVVVGLADMAGVPPAAWRAVADDGGDLVTAAYDGRPSPPVRIARSLWADLPTSGDAGARALMQRRPDLVRVVAVDGSAADVDRTGDLGPGGG
jgi:molybdenum cofactor cytidylyltransferase